MSSEVRFGGDVETIGETLGEAIADLPEYQAYKEAERAVQTSEEAQERIDTFENERERFMLARQTGSATQEDIAQLKELQSELHELPVMRAYLEAQAALEDRLTEINTAISDGIDIDFAGQVGGCCED